MNKSREEPRFSHDMTITAHDKNVVNCDYFNQVQKLITGFNGLFTKYHSKEI